MIDHNAPIQQEHRQQEKPPWSEPKFEKFEMVKTLYGVGTSGGDGGNETSI